MFKLKDVASLVRDEVKRSGTQEAFAKKNGVHRTAVNKVLTGARLPNRSFIDALGLTPVYVFKADLRLRVARGRR